MPHLKMHGGMKNVPPSRGAIHRHEVPRVHNPIRIPRIILISLALTATLVLFANRIYDPAQCSTATEISFRPHGTLAADADDGQPILPTIYNPQAVNAQSACPGYRASNVTSTQFGFSAILTLAGKACNVYGDDIHSLNISVQYQSADRLHVEITPTYIGHENQSWFVPPAGVMRAAHLDTDAAQTVPMNDLHLTWGNDPSFWIKVVRKSNSDVLFDTSNTKLVFENQFVEFVTALPEEYNLYGLGETIHALRLGNNFTKTMWNSDNADTVDRNIYGTHPVYYDTRYYTRGDNASTYVPWSQAAAGGNYASMTHAVYYRNAHAHEILLQPEGVTWRTLGGNIDLYFYAGPSMEKATQQYQSSTVGLPSMMQYWTFGYHQCRWGYNNWSAVEDVVANFEKFRIPLETQWNDIDWMYQLRNFISDPDQFPVKEGLEFLARLHASGRHYVHIIDSALYIPNPENRTDDYLPYSRGHDVGAFLLNPDGTEYVGAVWPGYTVFPDWLGSNTNEWWVEEVTLSHRNVPFDGLWIDTSEVSSFCVGSCGSANLTQNPAAGSIRDQTPAGFSKGFNQSRATEAASASIHGASIAATASPTSRTTSYLRTTPTPGVRNINYPPYAINNIYYDLAVHGVSPNATHRDELKTQEYDVHNLWGFGILNATYNALANTLPGKRPFIIGRSTFAGAGTVAGHWGGDNFSQWRYMYWSIPHALSMAIFGIPMFGVDTCGFNDNTDEELCNRWMMLSAFFPFYRNHNTIGATPQEPYRWASVIEASRKAMNIRYSLLPYIYTTFYDAHSKGCTVMRALAWEFPNEPYLASADRQFMLGDSLLITPVLEPDAVAVSGVFPGASTGTVWYNWYNQSAITDPTAKSGANVTIPAPLSHIPVFVRGGTVLPMQPLQDALTIREAQTHDWALLIGLDRDGAARGSLYLDDGESVVVTSSLRVNFTVSKCCLSVSIAGTFANNLPLANVTVMGVQQKPTRVVLNDKHVDSCYDDELELLKVCSLQNMTSGGAWSQNWQLTWS